MSEPPITRRRFLLGAAATLPLAGCAAVEPPGQPDSEGPTTVQSRSADDDRFVALYEAVREAVVELRFQVPENPFEDGGGSAFFIDAETLVTNAHVTGGRDRIDVRFADETWGDGEVIGEDPHSDLAVVEVDPPADAVETLALAESFPTVGEEVMAIGSPLGFSASASTGVVSGINRSLPAPTGFSVPAAIQTDAAVNPGNSGGPLITLDGTVVGVVFAGATETIGFAISTPLANEVLPVLQEGATYDHSYMGVQLREMTPSLARVNDVPEATGIYIHEALPDEPADGVLQGTEDITTVEGEQLPVGGDVIFAMDGTEIPHMDALSAFLALETSPGDEIELSIYRDGEPETVILELGTRPETVGMP